jgi:transcriptional regulator with XRE-family HTH domain
MESVKPEQTSFGQLIRDARNKRGLTVQQVAAAVQSTAQTVYTWERGSTTPHGAKIVPLASVLGLSVETLATASGKLPAASNVVPIRADIGGDESSLPEPKAQLLGILIRRLDRLGDEPVTVDEVRLAKICARLITGS